jgi:hypothetical protein
LSPLGLVTYKAMPRITPYILQPDWLVWIFPHLIPSASCCGVV